jgi:hypothetical protein
MNRQSKTNRGLRRRVYIKFSTYYYVAPEGTRDPKTKEMKTWIRLCSVDDGDVAMLNALAALLGSKTHVEGTMPHLCAEFKAKKLGKYTKETQGQYAHFLDVIADEFETFHVSEVTTKEFADFLQNKFAGKPNTARKYRALAAKLFKYAVSGLGLRQDNPIDQLDLSDFETQRRTVLLTHDQAGGPRRRHVQQAAQGQRDGNPDGQRSHVRLHYRHGLSAVGSRERHTDAEGGADRRRVHPDSTQQDEEEQRQDCQHEDHASHPERDRPRAPSRRSTCSKPEGSPLPEDGPDFDVGPGEGDAGIKDDVTFEDLRSLGATDAARAGQQMKDIQTRLIHTNAEDERNLHQGGNPGGLRNRHETAVGRHRATRWQLCMTTAAR